MVSTRNSTRFRHVALGVVLALGFVTTAAGAAATDGTHTGGHGAEEQAPDHHGGAQHGYPDVTAASKREIRQADRLRRQVRRAAAKRFPTYRTARRLGYVRFPGRWKRPLVFHLRRHDYDDDGRIFDARRPESLVYWWPKRGTPVLIAMMFRVPKGPRPAFAGPIPVYHQHEGHAGPGNP